MAYIRKKTKSDGSISYIITVSVGYGRDGKQVRRSKQWSPPEGMSDKKAEKQAQIEAMHFEEEIIAGMHHDDNIRFAAFSEKWMSEYGETQLKAKTLDNSQKLLARINEELGHLKLKDIRTGHINSFYSKLQKEGARQDAKMVAKADIDAEIKKRNMTMSAFSRKSNISETTLKQVRKGENVNIATAEKVSSALEIPVSKLFKEVVRNNDKLAPQTVKSYHRMLSSILNKAVKWGYIQTNPAANAIIPKVPRTEAKYLDENDVKVMLKALQNEPMNYRAAITFDLLSGLRRGELLGLRWNDVDFSVETVKIAQTSYYVKGAGLFTDTPKNDTSFRQLRLSKTAFAILREYKEWQDYYQSIVGDRWSNPDNRIFTSMEGVPIHPDALTKWFAGFAERCGYPGIHLHSLRHTYASLMIADGTPLVVVSKRMGHAQTSTTANIYAHMISSADEKAAQISDKFADFISLENKTEDEKSG